MSPNGWHFLATPFALGCVSPRIDNDPISDAEGNAADKLQKDTETRLPDAKSDPVKTLDDRLLKSIHDIPKKTRGCDKHWLPCPYLSTYLRANPVKAGRSVRHPQTYKTTYVDPVVDFYSHTTRWMNVRSSPCAYSRPTLYLYTLKQLSFNPSRRPSSA